MKKNYFLLLFAMVCFACKGYSQSHDVSPCATDQMRQQMILRHPEILKYEAQLEDEIQRKLKGIDFNKASRTTGVDMTDSVNFWYDIPIVVHIIHDYGAEYLTDDSIMRAFQDWNIVYSKQNYDTNDVIAPYKGYINNSHVFYIGNVHIRLHFATKDPNGNPSRGITRHRSYLTYIGGEESKLDDWPPSSYVNIWVVNTMSAGNQEAAAYAFTPPGAAGNPAGDGVICLYDYFRDAYDGQNNGISKTIPHEMGHVFNLAHPWGGTNNPQVALGDDNVDDTPPTWGHNPVGCIEYPNPSAVSSNDNSLYDTLYATNYYKVYPAGDGGDSVVNYPDTTNAQNIMDYTYCARMFTAGQVARMHAALNSDVAGRDNLWTPANLMITGISNPDGTLVTFPDYKPIPEYSATPLGGSTTINNYKSRLNYFVFPNTNVKIHNETWNDTVTNLVWTFSNTAAKPSITQSTTAGIDTGVVNSFTDAGWVSMTMTATGNNTGDTTVTFPHALFVANSVATSADGYLQSFNGSDTANWPIFNYYNNKFQWKWANVGLYDNSSVEYVAFDPGVDPADNIFPQTGIPGGDVDDLYTVPFDLSSFGSNPCYLNYNSSGGSRSTTSTGITDTMEIDYATKATMGTSTPWVKLRIVSKGDLDNKGLVSTDYTPSSAADWAPVGTILPAAAKTSYTVFRFRYLPGNSTTIYGTYGGGNNFYMDRVTFAQWPAYVNNVKLGDVDVAVVPNPTNGDAYVVVKDADNTTAQIIVTDVTGKVVYKTSEQVTGNEARILIPHAVISVQGMYIVQTITGNQTHTQKLIVE